jgi:hypothetical protein
MSMKKYVRKPWSVREREILRKNYYLVNKEQLQELLPSRTFSSITSQVHYLQKRGWYFLRETS